ncbi:MAG TPA: SRPBCC family protein [Archangium sp.]|uniref:SRPBCC family protein n=1 Tax=Archangium sp. TaxID=1872627 RepID=UPI002E303428|nr:SRPBCC family protein [Archangium sp.]HEX5748735.1 SRPBCC family protein [Archangium sp.]
MVELEQSVLIRRPLDEVFALASDPKNDPDWSAVVEQVEATGPLGAGVHLIQRVHLLGRRAHVPVEVLEYLPPTRVVLRASIPHIQVVGWRLFEPAPDGTRVTFRTQARLSGLFTLTTPIFVRTARKHLEEDLGQLRRLLESASFSQPLQVT